MALKRQRHLVAPSQSLVRKPTLDHPETQYCLEIQVISTEEGGTTPPPPHAWLVPVVEDMVRDYKSGLTEAVVTSPAQAILFYGQQSLGNGLSLGEMQDATFTLSEVISWVGKQAQLNTNLVSLDGSWWLITQAITKQCIEPRGPRCPCSIPPASSSFNFCNHDQSPWAARPPTAAEQWEVPRCDPRPLYQEQG